MNENICKLRGMKEREKSGSISRRVFGDVALHALHLHGFAVFGEPHPVTYISIIYLN